MNNHFKLLNKVQLNCINEDTVIPESDYSLLSNDGTFFQFKFHSEKVEDRSYDVRPGIWKIIKTMSGPILEPTLFNNDEILESFVNTKKIEEVVDCFFNNLDLYKEFGIEIPKRGVLLWGPAGTGKSVSVTRCTNKYNDGKTLILVWHTAAHEAHEVKDFIQTFNFIGVDKIILIAEDLGGQENPGAPVRSDSSLLSLLDNQEKTFKLPVMIIATTNFPENFASNLTNRAGRFDDKIKVGYPPGEARQALLQFFSKNTASEAAIKLIGSEACAKLPPSQIRECYIRSRLHKKDLAQAIRDLVEEAKLYEKAFSEGKGMGF